MIPEPTLYAEDLIAAARAKSILLFAAQDLEALQPCNAALVLTLSHITTQLRTFVEDL